MVNRMTKPRPCQRTRDVVSDGAPRSGPERGTYFTFRRRRKRAPSCAGCSNGRLTLREHRVAVHAVLLEGDVVRSNVAFLEYPAGESSLARMGHPGAMNGTTVAVQDQRVDAMTLDVGHEVIRPFRQRAG